MSGHASLRWGGVCLLLYCNSIPRIGWSCWNLFQVGACCSWGGIVQFVDSRFSVQDSPLRWFCIASPWNWETSERVYAGNFFPSDSDFVSEIGLCVIFESLFPRLFINKGTIGEVGLRTLSNIKKSLDPKNIFANGNLLEWSSPSSIPPSLSYQVPLRYGDSLSIISPNFARTIEEIHNLVWARNLLIIVHIPITREMRAGRVGGLDRRRNR